MAVVAGVFLDHVDVEVAHRVVVLVARPAERVVEGVAGGERVGGLDDLLEVLEILLGLCRVGEVEVTVGMLGGPELRLGGELGQRAVEPVLLDLGQVPDQSDQRHAGRIHAALHQLFTGQSGDFPQQCAAVEVEETREKFAFTRGGGRIHPEL